MQLVEPLEEINKKLVREYHLFEDGRPRFRVVWANDQLERRWTSHTPEGWPLLYPEVKELPKYQHCWERYVLEQLSIVPETDKELTEKTSYEPLWVFEDRHNAYLPPRFEVCKIVIDQMYTNLGVRKPISKEDSEESLLKIRKELDRVEQLLYGNETPVGDALAYGWGVSNPSGETKLGGKTPKEEVN